jgi:hypothetical protein
MVGKVRTGVHNTLLKVTTIRIRGDPISYVPTLGMDDRGVKNPRVTRNFFAGAALRDYASFPSGRGLDKGQVKARRALSGPILPCAGVKTAIERLTIA